MGILSPLAYVLVLYAVRIAPLSYVAPLREMSMLIAMFLGVRWLKEAFSIPRLCGTLGMFLGVILIACG